ncbi:MAG: adenylyltransferase/cytidyltransferase family protein [Planctomycetota bacterium]|nr:adenylyltransferase/cytidyltransferase family protein [Planctomycetota bacterium]
MTPLYRPAIQPAIQVPCERVDNPQVIVLGDLSQAERNCDPCAAQAVALLAEPDVRREYQLGGAAHICHIMRGLNATVTCVGVTGNDATRWELRRQLNVHEISELVMLDSTGSTNFRQRTLTPQQTPTGKPVPSYRPEKPAPLPLSLQTRIREQLLGNIGVHDALIITDENSVLFQERLIRDVFAEAQQHHTPVVIAAHGNYELGRYRKAALIQLTRCGAERTTGKPINTPQDALRIGTQLCQRYDLGTVIITLNDGKLVMTDVEGSGIALTTVSANTTDRTEIDAKVLAVMGVSLARRTDASFDTQLTDLTLGLETTGLRPSCAAGITSRQQPVTCATKHHPKILTVPELILKISQHRKGGQEIVFTNGCFDLLHAGHIACLTEAASLGDVLIVGMNSDTSVRQLKGPHRPRVSERDRAVAVATLESVDYVTIFDETTPLSIISALRPDALVKGGTYAIGEVIGKEVVESYGGKVTTTGTVAGISTTRILENMQRVELESVRTIQEICDVNYASALEISPLEGNVLEQHRARAPTCCEQLVKLGQLSSCCADESDPEREL